MITHQTLIPVIILIGTHCGHIIPFTDIVWPAEYQAKWRRWNGWRTKANNNQELTVQRTYHLRFLRWEGRFFFNAACTDPAVWASRGDACTLGLPACWPGSSPLVRSINGHGGARRQREPGDVCLMRPARVCVCADAAATPEVFKPGACDRGFRGFFSTGARLLATPTEKSFAGLKAA